jgi:hypothetical protein
VTSDNDGGVNLANKQERGERREERGESRRSKKNNVTVDVTIDNCPQAPGPRLGVPEFPFGDNNVW